MSKVVEVKLWGTTIGHLGYAPNQVSFTTFEYTDEFADTGIQISPIKMPVPPKIYTFNDISSRTFKGLPGIFGDSLPDKFGNQLIDLFMAGKHIPPEEITTLDRLLYIGIRGMGALEYHPAKPFADEKNITVALDPQMLSELAGMLTSKQKIKREKLKKERLVDKAIRLIRVGSSAGGARSKALVARSKTGEFFDGTVDHGTDHTYWIMKFDNDSNKDRDNFDPKGMPRVEYIYGKIAVSCGIDMPQIDFLEIGKEFHFLTERFDRIKVNGVTQKLHYGSWSGLAHTHRDITGAYSYEQLIMFTRQLGLGQDAVTELFRRAVFNIIGRNQDDHTKNFGFLMDKEGIWTLSPAFDMTYSYDPQGSWTSTHQIKLGNKQDGFTRDDLITFGKYCNLSEKKARNIISDIIEAFSRFKTMAKKYTVPPALSKTISDNIRLPI